MYLPDGIRGMMGNPGVTGNGSMPELRSGVCRMSCDWGMTGASVVDMRGGDGVYASTKDHTSTAALHRVGFAEYRLTNATFPAMRPASLSPSHLQHLHPYVVAESHYQKM